MLLLLVHGKLSNLTVEERFAFNVSLRMFTRSIVIQRRVEDLQLGVESYQKRLNLTKPNTYRTDLRRREAYTSYSNPRGFIYQNKDKKNILMRIDKLHKFSDGTLNDVRNALDDRLKGIRMQQGGSSIVIQGTDVAGFDKSKVECFNCHKMGHITRECRAPKSQDRGRRENFKQGSKVEESAPKALMVIDGVEWDWSYMANEEEDHALVAD
nr:hypothetical protein [Tanacetum cinerariifolium]